MTDEGVLRKIRALLAKAEATPFGPESEAFTAKAQELITRYRIDAALLAARDAQDRDRPVARRIDIDSPYLKAKVVLLSDIAQANDCRAIWPTNQRYVHLLGFPTDLDAVDEIVHFTVGAGDCRDAAGRIEARRVSTQPNEVVSSCVPALLRAPHRSAVVTGC